MQPDLLVLEQDNNGVIIFSVDSASVSYNIICEEKDSKHDVFALVNSLRAGQQI